MPARTKWLKHIRSWKASGDTARVYCERAGINAGTLAWWAWKLRSEGALAECAVDEPGLAPASLSAPTFVELAPLELARSGFELEVAAVTVRVPCDFESDSLSRLLGVLEARR